MGKQELVTRSLFNLEGNLANSMIRISRMIDPESDTLTRCLLYYFCYAHQYDIFNYGVLDPEVFSKTMNIDPANLRRKHPKPLQLQNMTEEEVKEYLDKEKSNIGKKGNTIEYKVFDTMLENALYVLAHQSFDIFKFGAFEKSKDKFKETSGVKIIRSLRAVYYGRNKILYEYILEDDFLSNMSMYYVQNVDIDAIVKTRRRDLDSLYVRLCKLKYTVFNDGKSSRTQDSDIIPFGVLCEIAGIPEKTKNGSIIDPFRRKDKLCDALDYIIDNTNLKFSYEWVAGPYMKNKYMCVMDFGQEEFKNFKDRKEFSEQYGNRYNQEKKSVFVRCLTHKLTHIFRSMEHPSCIEGSYEQNFYNWLYDRKNIESLKSAYLIANVEVYKVEPFKEKVEKFLNNVYSEEAKINRWPIEKMI